MAFFSRSKAHAYKDRVPGFVGLMQADSWVLRVILFAAMSLVFFIFLKITERKIPTGLVPDSTEDTAHVVQRPAK
jgi:hypothetical protein